MGILSGLLKIKALQKGYEIVKRKGHKEGVRRTRVK